MPSEPLPRILKLEQNYLAQIAGIRARTEKFGAEHHWQMLRRGRHAHASLYGDVSGLSGVINIEMVFEDWDTCPEHLEDSTPFTVFASVFIDTRDGRYVDSKNHFVETTLGNIEKNLDQVLTDAWHFVASRSKNDTTDGPYPIDGR